MHHLKILIVLWEMIQEGSEHQTDGELGENFIWNIVCSADFLAFNGK